MNRSSVMALLIIPLLALSAGALDHEKADAERGRRALTTRAFVPANWTPQSYDSAWKLWQPAPAAKPDNYDQAFKDYYGLHTAPYDNGRYPMGLREGPTMFFGTGIATDCMLCHGGSIMGKSYLGLGNSALDIQAVFDDLNHGSGLNVKTPFTFSNVRGTSEAGGMAVFLLQLRNPDLSLRSSRLDLGLRDDLCEDVPAWWLLKKKKTMYHTGTSDARSVRSIMQFMLTPTNSAAAFAREEMTFADIQAYLLTLEAPHYSGKIDQTLAETGRGIFNDTCSRCHGTYGEKWTYPNRIVPIDVIGTDRTRFEGFTARSGEHYNKSWLAEEKGQDGYKVTEPVGYQAPPLDGVWATAPYFHNGSVPTIYDVLSSKSRPKIYTRSFRTDAGAYDPEKVGWKVEELKRMPADLSAVERRKIYNTTQPGRGNGGHTFGDALTDEERRAVIEYLKTL